MQPNPTPNFTPLEIARFWNQVRMGRPHKCWEWTGGGGSDSYGRVRMGGRSWYTHQIAFQLVNGDIPQGNHVHHECRNKRCCNPFHLKSVTAAEHLRLKKHKIICKRGHPDIEANRRFIVDTDGVTRYRCRQCEYDRYLESAQRK